MTILHISDTHNLHKLLKDMPAADVIVHTGDFTMNGSEEEAFAFINWFCDLPYKHKVFIPGNHDFCLLDADNIEGLPDNCHFLRDTLTLEGITFGTTAGGLKVPSVTPDVLVTHEPPQGILDHDERGYMGDAGLKLYISEHPTIQLHLFGHIHDNPGIKKHRNTIFSNAAVVNHSYIFQQRDYHIFHI